MHPTIKVKPAKCRHFIRGGNRVFIMKGIVFTELLEMVEEKFSANMVDDIIDDCDLASSGAYTAVGTYPHEEVVALVAALSKHTGISVIDLLKTFGEHLFGQFAKGYPSFFTNITGALPFLNGIEDVIHAEVKKLYPDAELPRFTSEIFTQNQLVLVYESTRHFEDLAEGLIIGCIKYFDEAIELQRQNLSNGQARFILTRKANTA